MFDNEDEKAVRYLFWICIVIGLITVSYLFAKLFMANYRSSIGFLYELLCFVVLIVPMSLIFALWKDERFFMMIAIACPASAIVCFIGIHYWNTFIYPNSTYTWLDGSIFASFIAILVALVLGGAYVAYTRIFYDEL